MMKTIPLGLMILSLAFGCTDKGRLTEGPPDTSNSIPATPTNRPPEVDAVSPDSGQGLATQFRLVYTDPDGGQDLQWAQLLINSSIAGENACFVQWQTAKDATYLQDDAAKTLIGPVHPSESSSIANSQCILHADSLKVETSAKELILTIPLEFKESFVGPKKIYMRAQDKAGHRVQWQETGAWVVK